MKKIRILITAVTILSVSMVSAQEKSTNGYKTILKRPLTTTLQEVVDKANIKELVEFERFSRDNGFWEEMKKCYSDDSRVNIRLTKTCPEPTARIWLKSCTGKQMSG